jgi:hypothetical protein
MLLHQATFWPLPRFPTPTPQPDSSRLSTPHPPQATRAAVLASGHSRIPVYQGSNRKDIIGLILAKELVQYWSAEQPPLVKDVLMRPFLRVPADTPMFDMLNLFQIGRSHMAIVVRPYIRMSTSGHLALDMAGHNEASVDQKHQQQERQEQQEKRKASGAGALPVSTEDFLVPAVDGGDGSCKGGSKAGQDSTALSPQNTANLDTVSGVTVAPKPALAGRALLEGVWQTNVLGVSTDMLRGQEPVGWVPAFAATARGCAAAGCNMLLAGAAGAKITCCSLVRSLPCCCTVLLPHRAGSSPSRHCADPRHLPCYSSHPTLQAHHDRGHH